MALVIRKHIGYGPIDAAQAQQLQPFYLHHFNPYLNYHRPCAQPELYKDEQGRTRRRYLRYQTPWETLQKIPHVARYLREGMSLTILKRIAQALSDTEAAQRMQQAKQKLFQQLRSSA